MLCNLFDKKFASLSDKSAKGSGIKSMSDQQFSDELHQLIIRNFLKRRVYSLFKDNIWGADLADMESNWVFIKCHRSFW